MDLIDEFIDTDQKNIAETKRVLHEINNSSLFAINLCAELLQNFADVFGDKCNYDPNERIFNQWVNNQNLPYKEAFKLVKNSVLIGKEDGEDDETSHAKNSIENIYSILSRIYLLLRLRRDFFLGMAELLRLRYTTAIGYYRLQCESFSLLKIFAEKPKAAQDWMSAFSAELGKKFYYKYHQSVVDVIKEFGLHSDYERAASFSMHSRILGIASGILIGDKTKEDKNKRVTSLVYNEIDDPTTLFIWFTNYLKFHEKLLLKLPNIIPEFENVNLDSIEVKKYSEIIVDLADTLGRLRQRK